MRRDGMIALFGYCLRCAVCLRLDIDRGRCTVCRKELTPCR